MRVLAFSGTPATATSRRTYWPATCAAGVLHPALGLGAAPAPPSPPPSTSPARASTAARASPAAASVIAASRGAYPRLSGVPVHPATAATIHPQPPLRIVDVDVDVDDRQP